MHGNERKSKKSSSTPMSTRVIKQKAQPKKLQSEPPSILRKSMQATLILAAYYTIPKKTIQQPDQEEGELRVYKKPRSKKYL